MCWLFNIFFTTPACKKQQLFDIQNSKFDTSKSMSCQGHLPMTSKSTCSRISSDGQNFVVPSYARTPKVRKELNVPALILVKGSTFKFKEFNFLKVHIFWEGHKILRNLHRRFNQSPVLHRTNVRWRFSKIFWPSQNIWTLNRIKNYPSNAISTNCLVWTVHIRANFWFILPGPAPYPT